MTEKLKNLIKGYKEELNYTLRDENPYMWGSIQSKLGDAFFSLGKQDELGVMDLEKAIIAYNKSLDIYEKGKDPFYAGIHCRLTEAIVLLEERKKKGGESSKKRKIN